MSNLSDQDAQPGAILEPIDSKVLETLISNRTRFLNFLAMRLPHRAVAEDLLQQSLLKALQKQDTVESKDGIVPWFYSVLRNAVTDYYRAQASDERKNEGYARERQSIHALDDQFKDELCECFRELLTTLKPSYANVLTEIDLGGKAVSAVAEELGTTPNNVMVRLHRARQALRVRLEQTCTACAEHGCLNCTCSKKL
jgi:RNA polymerase sigma factor (sigma-70 family)